MKTNDEILEQLTSCTIEEDADLDVKENFYYKYEDVIKAMNEERKQEIDWNKLRDKFFRECTDPSPDSGRNAGIRPININSHNLFEWFRKEIEILLQ